MTTATFEIAVFTDLGDGTGRRAQSLTTDFIGTFQEAEQSLPTSSEGSRARILGAGVAAHFQPQGEGWKRTSLIFS